MESVFSDVVHYVKMIPHRFDSEGGHYFFLHYDDLLQYCCVLYCILVIVGPRAMEHREPFQLKYILRLWNLALAVFSILGSISSVKLMMFLLEDRSFYSTMCEFDYTVAYDGQFAFWIFSFMVSKIPEMLDTVFLCLRKKPIIFLHSYHHLTAAIFTWQAGSKLLPSGLCFATMNFMVHAVMYSYYFLCSCGLFKVVRPFAPVITLLQITQMIVGFFICLYTAFYTYMTKRGCDADRTLIRMGLLMYGSYFVLFVLLFVEKYTRKASRPKPNTVTDGKEKKE